MTSPCRSYLSRLPQSQSAASAAIKSRRRRCTDRLLFKNATTVSNLARTEPPAYRSIRLHIHGAMPDAGLDRARDPLRRFDTAWCHAPATGRWPTSLRTYWSTPWRDGIEATDVGSSGPWNASGCIFTDRRSGHDAMASIVEPQSFEDRACFTRPAQTWTVRDFGVTHGALAPSLRSAHRAVGLPRPTAPERPASPLAMLGLRRPVTGCVLNSESSRSVKLNVHIGCSTSIGLASSPSYTCFCCDRLIIPMSLQAGDTRPVRNPCAETARAAGRGLQGARNATQPRYCTQDSAYQDGDSVVKGASHEDFAQHHSLLFAN